MTNDTSTKYYDAIIIGAGISGISAAYHFQKHCPGKTYKILERRENLGGTWDLFKYPGIRSDSDMYTFGFSFKPWKQESSIAQKDTIIEYLKETVDEYGIAEHIQYNTHIKQADWSSEKAQWQVSSTHSKTDISAVYNCKYIFLCVGYYNYDQAYMPDFKGIEKYQGQVIHPQYWPENTDYKDKKILVIGSGATAVTLIPSLAKEAAHVTMLQRSPTYIAAKPQINAAANRVAKWFGHRMARWWFILANMLTYTYCQMFPQSAKKAILSETQELLGDKFDAKHFTPNYEPWDQRLCLSPDGDFFDAITAGKASIVTDHIQEITETGVSLESGQQLDADMIISATGLEMQFAGGIKLSIDGKLQDLSKNFIYKGFMCDGIPNLFMSIGYTNASWTLKVDLTNRYSCRLINHMDKKNYRSAVPEVSEGLTEIPLLDLSSGYIQRATHLLPKQASQAPWSLHQNFLKDKFALNFGSMKDSAMKFHP